MLWTCLSTKLILNHSAVPTLGPLLQNWTTPAHSCSLPSCLEHAFLSTRKFFYTTPQATASVQPSQFCGGTTCQIFQRQVVLPSSTLTWNFSSKLLYCIHYCEYSCAAFLSQETMRSSKSLNRIYSSLFTQISVDIDRSQNVPPQTTMLWHEDCLEPKAFSM